MDPEKNIAVNAYSGFKGNERPVSFIIKGREIIVLDVMERWLEPDKDYFKVLANDGRLYTLSWNREKDIWSVEKIGVKAPLKKR